MVQDNTKRCASKLIMVLFKKHTHLEKNTIPGAGVVQCYLIGFSENEEME